MQTALNKQTEVQDALIQLILPSGSLTKEKILFTEWIINLAFVLNRHATKIINYDWQINTILVLTKVKWTKH